MLPSKIHNDAKPLFLRVEPTRLVGWRMETRYFTYDALVQPDKTINVYIEWGDDQPDDMVNHPNWDEVRSHLNNLLKASA